MSHTCHSRVFSLVTGLLALLESTAEAPPRQVAKRVNRPLMIIVSFFLADGRDLLQGIALIPERFQRTRSFRQ